MRKERRRERKGRKERRMFTDCNTKAVFRIHNWSLSTFCEAQKYISSLATRFLLEFKFEMTLFHISQIIFLK